MTSRKGREQGPLLWHGAPGGVAPLNPVDATTVAGGIELACRESYFISQAWCATVRGVFGRING
jgi:hypothetical protein